MKNCSHLLNIAGGLLLGCFLVWFGGWLRGPK